jgi:hypothetical protein
MKLPERYSAARKALAACVKIDEVKSIRDKAAAMQVYAMQAKDGAMIAQATEIKMRATRRIGELMDEQKATGKRAKVGRQQKGQDAPLKLEDQGVDKNLAKRARTLAEMSAKEFEKKIETAITLATASTSGNSEVVKLARAERQKEKKVKLAKRQKAQAAKIKDLPDRRYSAIMVAPDWDVDAPADVRKWPIPHVAAPQSVLYLWTTPAALADALDAGASWEFEYATNIVWAERGGQHQLMLVFFHGERGELPEAVIVGSKDTAYEIIEKAHAGELMIELTRSPSKRDGWDSWGASEPEADAQEAEAAE